MPLTKEDFSLLDNPDLLGANPFSPQTNIDLKNCYKRSFGSLTRQINSQRKNSTTSSLIKQRAELSTDYSNLIVK